MQSVSTNGIKNNSITKRYIDISNQMLGSSKYTAQKTTRIKPDDSKIEIQRIEALPTISEFYNDIKTASYAVHANDVPFITLVSE